MAVCICYLRTQTLKETQMTTTIDDVTTVEKVTTAVAKEFDTYYRDCFWDEFHGEPSAKKIKLADLEPGCARMTENEVTAINIATVDYFILNCIDDVLGDDSARTACVFKIIEMAKTLKAKHGDAFDAMAIAKAFKAMNWIR